MLPPLQPYLVHHEAFDRGVTVKEVGEMVVVFEHVDAEGGANNEQGDLVLGLVPLLDGLGCGFLAQLRHLHHHHVLVGIQGGSHVGTHVGVLF